MKFLIESRLFTRLLCNRRYSQGLLCNKKNIPMIALQQKVFPRIALQQKVIPKDCSATRKIFPMITLQQKVFPRIALQQKGIHNCMQNLISNRVQTFHWMQGSQLDAKFTFQQGANFSLYARFPTGCKIYFPTGCKLPTGCKVPNWWMQTYQLDQEEEEKYFC